MFSTIGFGISMGLGVTRWSIYTKAAEAPLSISVNDLYAHGSPANLHLALKDYEFGDEYKAVLRYDNRPSKGWSLVYIAAFPRGRGNDLSAPIAIVKTNEPDNAKELESYKKQAPSVITGILENQADIQTYFATKYHRHQIDTSKIAVLNTFATVPNLRELQTIAIAALITGCAAIASLVHSIRVYRALSKSMDSSYRSYLVLPPTGKNRSSSLPQSYEDAWNRCIMLTEINRSEDAIEELRMVIASYPDRGEPYAFLAQIMPMPEPEKIDLIPPFNVYRQNDVPLKLCLEALRLAPNSPYVHLVHSQLLRKRLRFRESKKSIEEALRLNPHYLSALIEKSVLFIDQRQFARAVEICDEGLRRSPDEFALLNNKALALWRQGHLDEAAQLFDHTLRRDPNKAKAHYNRGALAMEQKQKELALEHMKIALRLNPHNWDCVEAIALLVPNRPVSVWAVHILLTIFGFPIVVNQFIFRKLPAANRFHTPIQVLALVFPGLMLCSLLCLPQYRPMFIDACSAVCRCSIYGPIFLLVIIFGLPWTPYAIVWLIFRGIAERTARLELQRTRESIIES